MKITIFTLGMIMATGVLAQTSEAPEASPAHTPSTAQEWFDGKDVNEDGFLVLEEVPGTRTETNFEMFDTNQDGMLSFEEYQIGRAATEDANGGGMGGMGGMGMGG